MSEQDPSGADQLLGDRLAEIDGLTIERSVPAGEFCTYRVGGPLALVARVDSTEALSSLLVVLGETEVASLPIGKGSNLLVADQGFDGVAIVLGDSFARVTIDGNRVVAGASAMLPVVARASVNAGLTGFEWAVGVPGSIGGAVRMNAGGHGSDMAASLTSVDIADVSLGGIVTRDVTSLALDYRTSNLSPWHIVVEATLELTELSTPGVEAAETLVGDALLSEIVGWRRSNQPGGANAGSVFTNPPGDSAGRLIDAAGLKGYRVGSAEVSPKHANFIQVDAGGSADDVMQLMVDIVDRVREHSGIQLHAETRLIGFPQDLLDHVRSQPSGAGD